MTKVSISINTTTRTQSSELSVANLLKGVFINDLDLSFNCIMFMLDSDSDTG